MSPAKPFCPALHEKYDSKAKATVAGILYTRYGITALEGKDVFGVDLVDSGGGWHEVETKAGWGDVKFPFRTVHIMARKLRLFEERSELDGYFWVTNDPCTRVLRIPAWCVLASPVVIAANKYTNREEVCDIPIEYAEEAVV